MFDMLNEKKQTLIDIQMVNMLADMQTYDQKLEREREK
jgi:hypothetical protein